MRKPVTRSEPPTVTVRVSCDEDQPGYRVLWEPTGEEFIVSPGDAYTFTFLRGSQVREDWTDVEMGVGSGWVYLGAGNLQQHEVIRNGELVWPPVR